MASPLRRDARRYRRRILVIGGALFGLLYVVMAPMYIDSVEADLEDRVPDELAEAGYVGVTATFDGQDGTLLCETPLANPEGARQAAYDIWGVRAIEVDRSCRVNPGAASVPATTTPTGDDEAAADTAAADDTEAAETVLAATATTVPPTDSPATTTIPVEPAFGSVAAAVAGSPDLSLLSVLLQESGLDAEFADVNADPVTLFAPSDDAFEALPADVLGGLRADPEALSELLWHHTAPGALTTDLLVAGDLEMSDGSVQVVATEPLSIGGIGFAETDIDAPNGVVHILSGVLVPDGIDPVEQPRAATVDVELDGTTVVLTGSVPTEELRQSLGAVAAAQGATVDDALMVDAGTVLDTATADGLAALIGAMTANLIEGRAGFDGQDLYLTGTYLTDPERDAVLVVAGDVGIEPTLTPPPEATADDAVTLEDELNAFVAENPILFDTSRSTITESSGAVLDQVALLAQQFDDITITVQGHTDTDGNANDNLWLSRMRARAVSDALIERGLASDVVSWEGFGGEFPIIVDGVEDKAASRRVEFAVEIQS